jgi:predicted nucleotidyltransferase
MADSSNWYKDGIILLVKGGSQAYGLNTLTSDVDLKGIAIPSRERREHLFQKTDVSENPLGLLECYRHLANLLNPKLEGSVYSLSKFTKLAAEVNPNIIELIFTDQEATIFSTVIGDRLRDSANLFLSARAGYTFTGYAYAQIAKINRHKKWLDNPPSHKPTRVEFGLPDDMRFSNSLEGQLKKRAEGWNFAQYGLDDEQTTALKQSVFDLLNEIEPNYPVGFDNWVDVAKKVAMMEMQRKMQLTDEMMHLLLCEAQYRDAKRNWDSYDNWRTNRNKDRAALEGKSGYDTKHAMHLIRLLRMGLEIVSEGKVIVRRPDREELMSIRSGDWSYERVMSYASEMEKKVLAAVDQSPLPKEVNREAINDLYQNLLAMFDA